MINIRTFVSPYPRSRATWATVYHLGSRSRCCLTPRVFAWFRLIAEALVEPVLAEASSARGVRAPVGRRPNGSPHLCRFAGIEGCGCSNSAVAAGDDMIGGLDESKAGRGGQWYHLIGGDLPFSCPRPAFVCGVALVGGDFSLSLSAHRDLACGGSQALGWLPRYPWSGKQRREWRPYSGGGRSLSGSGRPGRRFRPAWPSLSGWRRSPLPLRAPGWRRGRAVDRHGIPDSSALPISWPLETRPPEFHPRTGSPAEQPRGRRLLDWRRLR